MATWRLPPLIPAPKAPPVQTETVTANGADQLIARLCQLPQVASAQARDRMLVVAEECMADSRENYCPFLFGDLRASGVVFVDENGMDIILSYGGVGSGAEEYALEQHENLTYNHPGGGGAKYLEIPVAKYTDRFVAAAGQGLRETVELVSTGWASGDWKQIRVIREVPKGSVIKAHTRGGRPVKAYFRRKAGG